MLTFSEADIRPHISRISIHHEKYEKGLFFGGVAQPYTDVNVPLTLVWPRLLYVMTRTTLVRLTKFGPFLPILP